jgi:hypothetical protein
MKRDKGSARSESRADDGSAVGRAHPDQPTNWRDVVRADYDYPDELADLDRRTRRRAKRSWRRDDHAQRMAWLREQRQAEPTSPIAVAVAVLLLAIVVLGLGGGLPRLFGGDEHDRGSVGLLTPSASQPVQPTTSETASPGSSAGTASLIAPPPLTQRPSADATAAAAETVRSWAQAFYTRNPASETYDALVTKASKLTTSEVSDSLRQAGDSTYDALKANQGTSRVVGVEVQQPKADSAPVDTPTRLSRLVTITIDVSGKQPQRIVLPLLLTLAYDSPNWVISDINGGTGP